MNVAETLLMKEKKTKSPTEVDWPCILYSQICTDPLRQILEVAERSATAEPLRKQTITRETTADLNDNPVMEAPFRTSCRDV